jgi:hypothetical protein
VANSFGKMIVKNANTLAHGDVHLVVLDGIWRFPGSEMYIFHYTGGGEFL